MQRLIDGRVGRLLYSPVILHPVMCLVCEAIGSVEIALLSFEVNTLLAYFGLSA